MSPEVLALPARLARACRASTCSAMPSSDPRGSTRSSPASLEALRIEAGVPAKGAELTDATIPAEAGQW